MKSPISAFFYNSGPASAAENMAIDAKLLSRAENIAGTTTGTMTGTKAGMKADNSDLSSTKSVAIAIGRNKLPLFFRVYSWQGLCISFGRSQQAKQFLSEQAFQKIDQNKLEIVQRPSGGRALLHYKELSYAIASSIEHPFLGGGLRKSMLGIAQFLKKFLISLSIPEKKLHIQEKTCSPAALDCRAMHGFAEILLDGKKLIGSAQRRSRHAFLQHGSLPVLAHQHSLQEYLLERYREKSASLSQPTLENFIEFPKNSDPLATVAEKFISFAEKTLA